MNLLVRILFILAVWAINTVTVTAQQMRPQYHSFNSASPSKNTLTCYSKSRAETQTSTLYDSTYFFVWDTIAGEWDIKGKTITKSFDSNKNVLCMIGKVLNNGVWENSYKYNYTYNAKSKITCKSFYTWQGSWVHLKNELYTYNGHGDLTSYTVTQFNGSTWENIEKNVFTFDSKFNKLTESFMNGSGSVWLNNYQYIYEYDASNNRLNEIYQLGTDSTWRNVAKWSFVYDGNHNRISENYQNWDNGTFVNAALFLYSYDANNNITKQISQNWDNGAWMNSVQTSYTYDIKNNKTIEFVESWNGTNWENRLQTTFTYDKKNNNTASLMQEFIADKWVNLTSFKYVYDAVKHLTESLEQEWKNETWSNREKMVYTYNSNGDQTLETNFKWKSAKWTIGYYMLQAFDANFALTDESHKSWNIVTVDTDNNNNYPPFITGDSTHYFVHAEISTSLVATPQITSTLMVYPNPSNGIFNVSIGGQQAIENMEIYDSTGKLILKQKESGTVTIPNYLPGIYYIKLEHNSTQYSQRIVVQ